MNKKIASLILCGCLAVPTTFLLSGCGENDGDDKTVMNVSLNPEIEFILDNEEKVISVNAKNEEGNLILSAQTSTEQFVGKDADDAVKLFASYSKEMGFLFKGEVNSGDNNIKIQFSGDKNDADKLYKEIQGELNSYLSSIDIQGTVTQLETLTKEKIQELVLECEPYLNLEQIKSWSNDELINKLKQSRDETKEFLSQELKQAYYEAKEFAVNQAKFEYAKSQLNAIQKVALDTANTVYKSACDTLENTRKSLFVDEDSTYQTALTAFREKKTEFLNYKNFIQEKDFGTNTDAKAIALAKLDTIKDALDEVEAQLESAKNAGIQAIDNAKSQITTAYNAVVQAISSFDKDVNSLLDEAGKNITSSIETFETQFKTDYSTISQKAKQDWENMKTKLIAGYQE